MNKPLLLFYILIVFINGCSSVTSKDNIESPAPLIELTPTLTLKELWRVNAGGGSEEDYFKIAPVFYKGQLFTASPKGQVTVFNFSNGQRVWKQHIKAWISGGPTVNEGLILLGTQKGDVIALSESNGTEQWRVQVSSEILVPPRINQGVVVVRTIDGKLFGLDSQTGKRLWIYERSRVPLLTLRGISTPVVKHDLVIAGFDNGKIVALELHTGKVLWEAPAAVPRGRTELERMVDIDADPLLVDDSIYVTGYHGRTIAIDLIRGKLLWEKKLSSYTGLGVDFDYLYVSDTKSHIWALDRYSGKFWWKQEKLQFRNVTAPVSLNNFIIVGDFEGYLHWMHRDDGKFVARYRIGKASIKGPPLVVDDILVAYDSQGKIVALQAELPN